MYKAVLLVAFILLTLFYQWSYAQEITSIKFLVYEDGWVEVSLLVKNEEPGVLNLSLCGEPEVITVIDENGEPLDYDLESTTKGSFLIVYALGAKQINITYLTQSLTNKSGRIWTFHANVNSTFTILMPSNTFIFRISEPPLEVIENEYLILVMPPGSHEVEYIVLPQKNEEKESGYWFLSPIYLVLFIGIAIVIMYIVLRKMRYKVVIKELSEVDREIINFLKKRGGRAFQHEIGRELEIPKTTLWRHIMRLSEKGLIEVKKEGKYNLIILKF